MKPAYLYLSSLFVAILYIYLLAIQYVRGDHAQSNVDFNYHNYDQLTAMLRNYNQSYPHLTQLYSVGKSVQGEPQLSLSLARLFHETKAVSLLEVADNNLLAVSHATKTTRDNERQRAATCNYIIIFNVAFYN